MIRVPLFEKGRCDEHSRAESASPGRPPESAWPTWATPARARSTRWASEKTLPPLRLHRFPLPRFEAKVQVPDIRGFV